jgi:hypothetical protein
MCIYTPFSEESRSCTPLSFAVDIAMPGWNLQFWKDKWKRIFKVPPNILCVSPSFG